MDQLFLMQRYWGSDEEDSNCKISPEKKSNIPLTDLDGSEDYLSNKKQKLNSSFDINSKANSSVSCSDVQITNETKPSGSLENINNKFSIGTADVPSKLKPKKAKKQKLKDAKFQKTSEIIAPRENSVSNIAVNNDRFVKNENFNKHNLSEIINVDIDYKKEKKQRLRYFEFEENNNESLSEQHNQLNGITNNISKHTNKSTKSSFEEKIDAKNEVKSELRTKELSDGIVVNSSQYQDSDIISNKKKKKKQRYFDAEEVDNKSLSMKYDQLNEMSSNTSMSIDKAAKSFSQKKFNVENEVKSELRNDSDVGNSGQDQDSGIISNKKKKKRQRYFDTEEMSINTSMPIDKAAKSFSQEKFNVENEVRSELRNDSDVGNSGQYQDSDIISNKKKKKRQRYFDTEEIDDKSISIEQDKKIKHAFTTNAKKKESPLHRTIDVDNEIKLEEIDGSNVDNFLNDDNMLSQDVDNENKTFPTIGQIHQQKNETVKHTLTHWFSNPTYISVNLQEKEIPVSELTYLDRNTKNNLMISGINFLFPVQLAVIPWLMQSKEQSLLIRPSDICVSAPTGSGKTLAFVLPIVQSLKDRVVCSIRALVVLPVSELAFQVYKVFQASIKGTDLKVALLTGKKSFIAEQNFLVKSTTHSVLSLVDIVVATPGRVHDHIYRTQGFCLKQLRYLVIDEADRMMEEIQQGWLKQVEDAVFRNDCISPNCVCSSYKRTFFEPTSAYNFGFVSQPLQKLLYSATLTHDPEQLHTLSLYKPKLFTASSVSTTEELHKGLCVVPPGLKMLQVTCEEGVKPMVICHLIKQHNFKRVLCFTETVERAHRLHLVLEGIGLLKVREISSFNTPIQRKIALEQFKLGKIDILVCSDLVARGIDIKNIDCVISYDIPQYVKIYIHRIGRTARAGKTGTAIALLSERETTRFKKMLNASKMKLPEKICISSNDLKPLIKPFKSALSAADAKLKKEKSQTRKRLSKKIRRK